MRPSAAWLLPLALCACGRDEIRVYRLAKSRRPRAGAPAAAAPAPAPAGAPAWKTPAGWVEEPASGMRAASFRAPGGAEMSVVSLEGDAGGALANVNRWRGQLGLPPLSEAELARVSSKVRSAAGEAELVEFSGAGASAGRRVAAATLPLGGRTWFFKLTGPEAAVEAARPSFLGLLRGLRR